MTSDQPIAIKVDDCSGCECNKNLKLDLSSPFYALKVLYCHNISK